ncbi:retention module-containing protein [Campylobacter concisus]|uniref:retention module-containing protein n=1 Tax=Campylobacter concisus TaxID=199 RepID=UPI001883CBA8|nr:retention module-containing protein [Campylobacter concisus]MBE9851572.1 retention module-containing protein [Campylobacter concisus]
MSKEIGVVKNVTQGSVKAVSITGESRELKVGDIVYQGEKIVTESTDAKVVIAKADGKEISLIGKDSINLDQSVSENSQTTADINSLQKAILSGQDLNALEETAAGGPQAGGNAGGDGVSLGAASFAQGGHYSNITDDFRGLDSIVARGTEGVSSIAGGADLDTLNSNITDDFRGLDSIVARGTEGVSSIAGGADLDTLSVAIDNNYATPVTPVHETIRISFDEVNDARHDGNLDPNVSSHLDISNNILENPNSHKSGLQLTNDNTPTLAGKSTPGATISLFDGEGEHAPLLGRTTVDSDGNWEYTPTTALAEGDHKITVEATKTAADGSELKETTYKEFTVDSINDTLTLNVSTDQVADLTGDTTYLPTGTSVDTNLKFSGKAEANADIYLKIIADDDTYNYYPDHAVPKGDIADILKTTADANGDWSISAEKPNWSYTYKAEVTSVDEAGNTYDYAPTTFYIPMESISVAPMDDHL